MEGFLAFVQDNLVLLVVALIAIILVISLVKTVIKWVIVAIVVVGILVYGFNYDVSTLKTVGEKVLNYTKEEVIELLVGDVENATYEESADGSFTIFGNNMRLDGKIGSNEIEVVIAGQSFTFKIDESLQKYIDQVKSK